MAMGGKVLDALTMQPVAGVTVRAVNPTIWMQGSGSNMAIDSQTLAKTETAADGSFMFETLDLDLFYIYVVLVFGDADGSNTTYVNTAMGTVAVQEASTAVHNQDTAYLDKWKSGAEGLVIPRSMVSLLEAGPLAGTDLLAHGFVVGIAADALGQPVDGISVAKAVVANSVVTGTAPLTKVAYRDDAASFAGTSTIAQLGAQFVVADDLPMVGLDPQLLVAMRGQSVSTGVAGEAVSVPGFAFLTQVQWIAP
jgi:hypothetical protein